MDKINVQHWSHYFEQTQNRLAEDICEKLLLLKLNHEFW